MEKLRVGTVGLDGISLPFLEEEDSVILEDKTTISEISTY